LEMITELLDFARQRTDRDVLRREMVRFDILLAGVLETVRPLADEKDLELQIDLPDTLPPCWLDGEKIYRVYLNLVENAIKFSSQGVIRMGARPVDHEIEGTVSDQGIGIPAGQLEEIFEAFRQVDASSTRSYPGVGLGLAICRQLIELHGGRIWAESIPGRGSTFRFRVPCPPPPAAPAPDTEA
ncbi:MAG: sensor histidine kinase, partial [Gemmatimonadota bacterium]